jgi:hypothetical protein
MIPIVVYASGNIITGPTCINYENPSRFFLENKDTCFDEVGTTIYGQLGLLEKQYF